MFDPFTVGAYVFTDYLGSGSSGEVFLCYHSVTREALAGKRVDLDSMYQDDFFRHIVNELRIHSRLSHPCIAEVKDIVMDDQYLYVIMEYIEGGDLNAEVQDQDPPGLTEDQAKVYFYQIISALNHLHKNQIAHRDIKLENILITVDGRVKLSDFGLSRVSSIGGVMETVCGTLVYTAPEIIREDGYSIAVDIWSAGVLLYAMMACHFPWTIDPDMPEDQLFIETQRQILEGYVEFPDEFGLEVQQLISSMLSLDPRDRPTCEELLEHPWFADVGQLVAEHSCTPNQQLIALVETTIGLIEERRRAH